jgi:predicted PurR-regulated permease PerM
VTKTVEALIWTGILVVVALTLYAINDILLPFLVGMAIAYFLDPTVDQLQKAGLSRMWATSVITICFFAVLVALLILLVPLLQDQLVAFFHRIPDLVNQLNAWFQPILADVREMIPTERLGDVEDAGKGIVATVAIALAKIAQGIWAGGLALFNIVSLILITPVVAFYMLRDWDIIVVKVDTWLPRAHADNIRTLLSEIDMIIAGFVRGTGTVVLFLATVYAGGLTLIGLDFGLLVGLVAGFLSFIPYVGALSGLGVSLIIAIVQWGGDLYHIVLVLVVFGFGQVIESYYLTPKLVGERVGLHPVWVIFALFVGGLFLGFTGILLAVPIAATIGVLVRFFLGQYLMSPLYSGADGDSDPGGPGIRR